MHLLKKLITKLAQAKSSVEVPLDKLWNVEWDKSKSVVINFYDQVLVFFDNVFVFFDQLFVFFDQVFFDQELEFFDQEFFDQVLPFLIQYHIIGEKHLLELLPEFHF